MLLFPVRNLRQPAVAMVVLLLTTATLHGQSLGEVARESREKNAESTAPTKVITDGDLDAAGQQEPAAPVKGQTSSPAKAGIRHAAATGAIDSRAAEQWKKQILAQKRTVATLEKRLARYQASLSSVDANAIARGEIFSRSQALEQERIARAQEQLDEQKAKLAEMQEEARRAGMHTQVYDP